MVVISSYGRAVTSYYTGRTESALRGFSALGRLLVHWKDCHDSECTGTTVSAESSALTSIVVVSLSFQCTGKTASALQC